MSMLLKAGLALALAMPALAQLTPAQVRGGWEADIDGQRHIFILKARDTGITGIYCWDCNNPDNLRFVQNGKYEGAGLTFEILHDIGPGAPYREDVRAKLEDGKLLLTIQRRGGGAARTVTYARDPRTPATNPNAGQAKGPAPNPGPGPANVQAKGKGGGGGRGGYVALGPNEKITEARILGLWVGFGTGQPRQHFMFRRVGDKILGMVCGPCDNPYTFGTLDTFVLDGEKLTWNIVHEDWGNGTLPFNNMVTATMSHNEIAMTTMQDNLAAQLPFQMVITGPIQYK